MELGVLRNVWRGTFYRQISLAATDVNPPVFASSKQKPIKICLDSLGG
jgi:hypothetical protein